jgi:hypothetical protein
MPKEKKSIFNAKSISLVLVILFVCAGFVLLVLYGSNISTFIGGTSSKTNVNPRIVSFEPKKVPKNYVGSDLTLHACLGSVIPTSIFLSSDTLTEETDLVPLNVKAQYDGLTWIDDNDSSIKCNAPFVGKRTTVKMHDSGLIAGEKYNVSVYSYQNYLLWADDKIKVGTK